MHQYHFGLFLIIIVMVFIFINCFLYKGTAIQESYILWRKIHAWKWFYFYIFSDQTHVLIDEAKNIKTGGPPGAFEKEFSEMEKKLDEVKEIIANSNVTMDDVEELKDMLSGIRCVTITDEAVISIHLPWKLSCKSHIIALSGRLSKSW